MRFTKMHGCSNDFVLTHEPVDSNALSAATPRLCNRRTGVGADGVILLQPSQRATLRMRIFNADGSEAEMCGNGIRCAFRYAVAHGLASGQRIEFETGAGIIVTEEADGLVRVDMGKPVLRARDIPVALDFDIVKEYPLDIDGRQLRFTAVSMGNPHAVFHVDELSDALVLQTGRKVECHPLFPRRVNAEFVTVLGRDRVRMRVFERGVGETMACGTGACAVAVAGILTGRHDHAVWVELPGGELHIEWSGSVSDSVFMTGPAVTVFEGEVDLPGVSAG
jgi:diaminopimelate epimerase